MSQGVKKSLTDAIKNKLRWEKTEEAEEVLEKLKDDQRYLEELFV